MNKNAEAVIRKRIAAEGETWEDVCCRVAQTVSRAEPKGEADRWADRFFDLMVGCDFLPNSPTLRNFGRNKGCGSACFVLPIEDSRRSIFKTLSDAVDVQAYGGGTGFSFSRLRPKGDPIVTTGGQSSGPCSFIASYDFVIGDIIKQGGTRAGANMAVLRVDHPDIEEFIAMKAEEGRLKNFNISVGITDAFIKAVKEDRPFDLVFNGEVRKTVPARKIWGRIVEGIWKNGEPGVLFLDTINEKNPLEMLGEIEACNPCGEQPLLPYGSCNLGSINLANMVKGDWLNGQGEVDFERLKEVTRLAVRFLDDVISVNHYPIPEIEEMALKTRPIGLGVMGFADLLIKLQVRYGDLQSQELAQAVMTAIDEAATAESTALGEEKGIPMDGLGGRRNGTLTSIAPTGTLSLIADCSSGIEPHFSLAYKKACLEGELEILPKVVREYVAAHGGEGDLPEWFVTALEVPLQNHIDIQAAFQSAVDTGVSKTVNCPETTSTEKISKALFYAWDAGCKGVTLYRDGSRKEQALYTGGRNRQKAAGELPRGAIKARPRATAGPSVKMQTACGRLYSDVHFDLDGLCEVFVRTAGGGCEANAKAIGVLCSMVLRAGVSPEHLAKKLKEVHCPACTRAIAQGKAVEVRSCAAGIGKSISLAAEQATAFKRVAEGVAHLDSKFRGATPSPVPVEKEFNRCPECGSELYQASGCRLCSNPECGWSKC